MDHAYITGVGLLLILVDSFSGWSEVICVPDKKRSTIKQILRVLFSRNGRPKILVSDNAPVFCDEDLNLWLEKIGCNPYKIPPYHPQSNGLEEKTVIMGLKILSKKKKIDFFCLFLLGLLLSYRTIPHAGRLESPSTLMGRRIRTPLTMSYIPQLKKCGTKKKNNKESNPERAEFIMQKSHNTAIINREKGNGILTHADKKKLRGRIWRAKWGRNLYVSFR